jgi:molybdenum cofactor sulfurtransferase
MMSNTSESRRRPLSVSDGENKSIGALSCQRTMASTTRLGIFISDVFQQECFIIVTTLCAAAISAFVTRKMWTRKTGKSSEEPMFAQKSTRPTREAANAQALKRKRDFLSRIKDGEYGYRDSHYGYIDDWRPVELPQLQFPLEYQGEHHDNDCEQEVYLDYAGSALPIKSQLEQNYRTNATIVLANPHSTGPAAARTLLKVKQAKTLTLRHFGAMPGKFASLRLPESFHGNGKSLISDMDRHAGYDVVFTSGATEGFKTIAERFPWRSAGDGDDSTILCSTCTKRRRQTQSILLYATNSHNSVVGMRQLAKRQGAIFHCVDMQDLESITAQDLTKLEASLLADGSTASNSNSDQNQQRANANCNCTDSYDNNDKRHLLVFSSECNFGGDYPDAVSIIAIAKQCGWYTMLDIAKAASTGPVNLGELNPDFAALSFYKLFGDPTGLGALLVKRSSIPVLFENDNQAHPHYQGGGSVNIMMPKQDYIVPKGESLTASLDSLTSGSVHFRGIANIANGFKTLERLGGMPKIHAHTTCLARELARRLRVLKHGNDVSAVQLYGVWSDENHFEKNDQRALKRQGPTVAFNVVRSDGSVVGYNEVSKLAALNNPSIQFRTGCFCNPGACQQALGLSDEQVIENFEKTGHVCGDHIDTVNGLPTGAIRISFGKDSIWEDLDAVVQFLEVTFVNHRDISLCIAPRAVGDRVVRAIVSELYLFPIKSCAAQRVTKWLIEVPSGKLRYDREFALVDTTGTALRLQTCPKLGLISPRIDPIANTMTVCAPGCQDLVLSLSDDLYHGGDNVVQVCSNKCGGRVWGDADASEWFSSFLGIQCWLARYSTIEDESRHSNTKQVATRIGFSNEQPILLVSEDAVNKLNSVLIKQGQRLVDSKRFRPNIVVKTHGNDKHVPDCSHIEDEWKSLALVNKDFRLKVEGACPRCTMVDFDPMTGQKGRTLRALAKYRRKHSNINFGIFLQAISSKHEIQKEICIEEGDLFDCS